MQKISGGFRVLGYKFWKLRPLRERWLQKDNLLAAGNQQVSSIEIFINLLADHAAHPGNPEDVIRVFTGNENMADMGKGNLHIF